MVTQSAGRAVGPFKRYVTERSIFRFEDYQVLLDEVAALQADRILEFGPGISTDAFLEAGCSEIWTFEYQQRYVADAVQRFRAYSQVSVHSFVNETILNLPELERQRFDLAFVDTPVGEGLARVAHPGWEDYNRLNTVIAALKYAPVVLLHDCRRAGEQKTLDWVCENLYCTWELIPTKKGIARIRAKVPGG